MTVEQEKGELVHPVPLKEILIDATLSREIAISEGITRIDLGEFGKEAEGLLQRSLEDPRKLERGRPVFVTPHRRVLIATKDIVGEETEDGQKIGFKHRSIERSDYPVFPWNRVWQDSYVATVIHSHGKYLMPPSPNDITNLLSEENIRTLTFLITPQQKILVFRSSKTPMLEEEKVKNFTQAWKQSINFGYKLYRKYIRKPNDGEKAFIQYQLFHQVVSHFELKVYSCKAEENIAVLSF